MNVPNDARAGLNEPAAWTGRIFLGADAVVFAGQGGVASPHAPPMHKLFIGRHAWRSGERSHRGRATSFVPAGVAHAVEAEGALALVYLDARRFSLDAAEQLARRWRSVCAEAVPLDAMREDLWRAPRPRADPRTTEVLDAFCEGATLTQLSERHRRSTSRLTHLVSDAFGVPLRAWRTWTRLRAAVAPLQAVPRSITNAAHEAGFADAAHFTRACRAMLGVTPTMLLRSEFVELG